MGFKPKINSNRCRRWFGFAKKKILTLKKYEIVKKIFRIGGYEIIVKPTTNKAIIKAPPGLHIICPGEEYLDIYYADEYNDIGTKAREIDPFASVYTPKDPATVWNLAWPGGIVAFPQVPDYLAVYVSTYISQIPTGRDEQGNLEYITYNGPGVLLIGNAVLASFKTGFYKGFTTGIEGIEALGSVVHAEGFTICIYSANVFDGSAQGQINFIITLHNVMQPASAYYLSKPDPAIFPPIWEENNLYVWDEKSFYLYPCLWAYLNPATDRIAVRFMHLMYSKPSVIIPTLYACFLFAQVAPAENSVPGIYGSLQYTTVIALEDLVEADLLFIDFNYETNPALLDGQGHQKQRLTRNVYVPVAPDEILLAHYVKYTLQNNNEPGSAYITLNMNGGFAGAADQYALPYVWHNKRFPHCSCGDGYNLANGSQYIYWEEEIEPDYVTQPPPFEYGSKWVKIHKLGFGRPLKGFSWLFYPTNINDNEVSFQLISFTPIVVTNERQYLLGVFYASGAGSYFGVLDSLKENGWRLGKKISDKRLDRAECTIFGDSPDVALFKRYRGMRNFWASAYYSGIGNPE